MTYKAYNYGKKNGPLRAKDDRHGSMSGYSYWQCRCDKCCDAASEYNRRYRERKMQDLVAADHGRSATYALGCRCSFCLEAYRQARAQRDADRKQYYYQNRRNRLKLGDLA